MAEQNLTDLIAAINRLAQAVETIAQKPIEFRTHKPKRLNSTEMIRQKIINLLSQGDMKFGVICNRIRAHTKDELAEHLDEMASEGILSVRITTHPINSKQTPVYGIAAVLNRPQGPEGDE